MRQRALKLKFRIIFVVLTCLAILAADLTITLINKYILSYKGVIDRHYVTLAGMTVVLLIFYFLVSTFSKISEYFVEKFVHITRVYLGREVGLYISVAILFLLIYSGYYWTWFDRNLFGEIWGVIISLPGMVLNLFR